VAVEEPLEIRFGNEPIAVLMRTPGEDTDLARGFLITEAVVSGPEQIQALEESDPDGRAEDARLSVQFAPGSEVDPARFQRNLFVSSSCGVCGKASIEAVQLLTSPVANFSVSRTVVSTLTAELSRHQPTFEETGGLHAAGIFALDGTLLAAREDVGRHNAVDKVVGALAFERWPLPLCLLVVSGRQSFEIVQKAAVAGIGGVVGVSAPSSLAVELSSALGMLLVGFAREGSFNVYAGAHRLID
jgi:FdhD protein